MPIFDTRSSTGVTVESAHGYSDHDMARIMSECAINDMRLFNVAIARDFQEAAAIHEGSMSQQELAVLREFSIKEAWKGLKERVKKLWGKIKNVFRTIYAKLSLYLNRNVKAYIAQNKKYLLSKKNLHTCPIPKYMPEKNGGDLNKVFADYERHLKGICDNIRNDKVAAGLSVGASTDEEKDINSDTLYEEWLEEYFDDADPSRTYGDIKGKLPLSQLFTNLSNSSKYLKQIKKQSKTTDDMFKKCIAALDKKAVEVQNAKNEGYSLDDNGHWILQEGRKHETPEEREARRARNKEGNRARREKEKAEKAAKRAASGGSDSGGSSSSGSSSSGSGSSGGSSASSSPSSSSSGSSSSSSSSAAPTADDYKKASENVAEFQKITNATTSAMIRLIKKAISNDRGLIAALVAHDPTKTENAMMTEFAFAAGHDSYFHEVDDMSEEEVAAEAEEAGITTVTIEIDGDAEVDVNDETEE